eukprot:TRINITY_DN32235_c0_g1_i1.p1 TRINITY_DN32235_c0_g1~~TRINITY_DN32235_c0_g1_i1.p1  ORF type:complete len:1165 (+),score=292.50 TRINITY_DN32235_c0_g1_i1:71-3496(+)
MSRPPAYVSPKLQARVSVRAPPPPRGLDTPGEQARKIRALEVEEGISNIVAACRPQGPSITHHTEASRQPVSGPHIRSAPRHAVDQGDAALLQPPPQPSSSPALQGFAVEFVAGQLSFATDLALLFLSCMLPIVSLSGSHVLSILLVGAIASYIFDYTNQQAITLPAVWLTILAVWIGLYLTNLSQIWTSPLTVLILLNASLYLVLIGTFASVQFKWFQLHSPELALVGERVLLGVTPLVCLPLLFSTVVSVAGVKLAPFLLALLMVGLHRRFYSLRKSSFKQPLTPEAVAEQYVNGRLEALVSCVLTLVLPAGMHLCIERMSTLTVLNCAALIGGPTMLLFADVKKHLWFMFKHPYGDEVSGDVWGMQSMRALAMGGGYCGVLHCFAFRIVMGRYGYLFTGVPPPWNVVLIMCGLYALSITVVFAVQLTALEARRAVGWNVALRWMGVLIMSVAGCTALAFVVGMPRYILPFSALSAACLTAYCLDRRNLNNYLMFAGCTVLMLMWWMFKSFSFLLVELPILGGSQYISLPQLSVYIVWLYMLDCCLFPGALNTNPSARNVFSITLVAHAAAMTGVEHILYSQPENLYPSLCVIFTSCWGAITAERLLTNRKISRPVASLLVGMYCAKLYLFMVCSTSPEPGSDFYTRAWHSNQLIFCFVCATGLAACYAELLFERRERKRRASTGSFAFAAQFFAVCTAILSRQNIVLALLELSTGNGSVQQGRLLGLVVAFAGALLAPLSALLPPSKAMTSRIAYGLLGTGAMIALLDPVFESGGETELELDLYQSPTWAGGLAVVAVAAVSATLLNIVRLPDAAATRMVWWGAVSLAAGVSFTELYLPYPSWHTSALMSLVMILLALCIDFCHFSENAQSEDSNTVVGLYTALLLTLLAAFLDGQWRFPESFDDAMKWEVGVQRQMSILSLNAGVNILLAALMKLKLAESPVFVPKTIAKIDSIRNLMGEGLHFGLLCNICALQGYLSFLILNSDLGGTGHATPVMLSVFLLLMHDDGWLGDGIGDTDQLKRWAAPLAASLCTIGWHVCWVELPALLAKSPLSFAVQVTIFMSAVLLGCVTLRELWVDSHRRRREGPSDGFVVGVGLFMLLAAGTPGVRWAVGVTVLGASVPLYSDTFWARKLSAVL